MNSGLNAVRLDPGIETLAARLACIETPCVVATVVSATGSTYSKPGARMLIESDGRITGLLGGGCLEHDLREQALAVLAGTHARTVTYDMRTDNDLIFGLGAGCEGCMVILLEAAAARSPVRRAIAAAAELAREGAPSVLVAVHEGPAEMLGTDLWQGVDEETLLDPLSDACSRSLLTSRSREFRWTDQGASVAAWIQPVLPLPATLICGGGPDAVPLAAALRALHFPVTVTDHRAAYAVSTNFPGSEVVLGPTATLASRLDLDHFFAAVVMSHHLPSDVDYLGALAQTSVRYLGVLGPERRRRRLLAQLGHQADGLEARLRGPIGLDIGAVTPEGIALAIVAEIHSVAAIHNAKAAEPPRSLATDSANPPLVRSEPTT